mgnify:CR=1 FL=1
MYLGIHNIDHPVIASQDLDATRAQFERLGFTVPPRGSHIEWGTGNLCIMFPDDYLGVRGIIDPERFTMHLDEHLEKHGEGLMGVAFGTTDVKASYAEANEHGINTGELRSLRRNFEHPVGWTQPAFDDSAWPGGNHGIGYETARMLAHAGARVVLACRSEARGREAVEQIRAENPQGEAGYTNDGLRCAGDIASSYALNGHVLWRIQSTDREAILADTAIRRPSHTVLLPE